MVHCGDNGRQRCGGRRFPALRLYFPVHEKSRGSAYNRYTRICAKSLAQNKKSPPPPSDFSPSVARITGRNRKIAGRGYNLTLAAHLRRAIVMATSFARNHDPAALLEA